MYLEQRDINNKQGESFTKASPKVVEDFGNMVQDTLKEGPLPTKTKELIAVGIAVTVRCENCIIAHVGNCVDLGVTREELADALGVDIIMNGGPGYAYASKALAVYDELKAAK